MKLRWIIVAVLISMIVHISIMMAVGKIPLSLPYFDFIETYLFQSQNKKTNSKISTKIEQAKMEQQLSDTSHPIESTESEESITEKYTESHEIQSLFQSSTSQEPEKLQPTKIQYNPFTRFINETMKFDIYWIGIYVGSAVVSVRGNEHTVTITSSVKSASFISNFYYVDDRAESKTEKGRPKHFTLVQIEGKYRGNKETIFDYEKGEIIFINHLKNSTTYHKGVDRVFMDVLMGFFYLRTLPINLNEPVPIDIFDSNKFTTVMVEPIKEEKIELSNHQIDTIVVKPKLDTEGLFKRKGDIIIWLSKDENKIPLKVETKVPVGKVVAELREYIKD